MRLSRVTNFAKSYTRRVRSEISPFVVRLPCATFIPTIARHARIIPNPIVNEKTATLIRYQAIFYFPLRTR
ncbi:hypothetical protein WP3W18E06_13950 [Raoultella ornithinolytica]|nr:hypothetical protein WP3W18E06_13950 [Raoultella ornithinolytica]VTN48060.1 Uncharacterised protein [Raoultella ornithinolytica]